MPPHEDKVLLRLERSKKIGPRESGAETTTFGIRFPRAFFFLNEEMSVSDYSEFSSQFPPCLEEIARTLSRHFLSR